jgi:hypothetical protein
MARKHKEWLVGRDGRYEGDDYCDGRVARPPDRDLEEQYQALLAERFGPARRRSR